ncbi:hypothetical protein Pmi06nite_10340 [Planotetraspora mira]|uniref:Uncharacterized protein n=1 Tax=Planotetraspora mira TaxID=58121 RepID=A0A8J3X4E7_9ACTN|nr:hypothetical protein Pmi06nite_10340 [Planotetraspora mira]
MRETSDSGGRPAERADAIGGLARPFQKEGDPFQRVDRIHTGTLPEGGSGARGPYPCGHPGTKHRPVPFVWLALSFD